jgi:hypothetical protein
MEIPGEKLLARLWETVAEKGIGALLKPWQMRRVGKTMIDLRKEELLVLAQAERDAQAIRDGGARLTPDGFLLYGGGPVGVGKDPTPNAVQAAVEVVARSEIGDAIRKEINVSKALLAAEADLENDPEEPPAEHVDADWLFRWRECAGAVSSEELQGLWGRVLSGQVRQPGRYSFRTLEFIRNISFAEAKAINEICTLVIADSIVIPDKNRLDKFGIDFGKQIRLQELGVVSGVGGLGLTISFNSLAQDTFVRPLLSSGRTLVVRDDDPKKELTLPCLRLTDIGKDLFSLGRFMPNEDYLRKVAEMIVRLGFNVLIADYLPSGDGQIRYFNAIPVTVEASGKG